MAEAPQISEIALAPDGSSVAYVISRGSVRRNEYESTLLLQHLDAVGAARGPATLLASSIDEHPTQFVPRWHPSGNAVTYLLAAPSKPSQRRQLFKHGIPQNPPEARNSPESTTPSSTLVSVISVGADYRWSPRGRYIAFTSPVETGNGLDPRKGIPVTAQSTGNYPTPRLGLFILEIAAGTLKQITLPSLHIQRFDWSPDETELVIAASSDAEGVPEFRSDLYVVERGSGRVRVLVKQPGLDHNPKWSPDGRWIAFSSQFGTPSYYQGQAALISAKGGEIRRITTNGDPPSLSLSTNIRWSPNSQQFCFDAQFHMGNQLFCADIYAPELLVSSQNDEFYIENFSASADGARIAFTRSNVTTPADLYVQSVREAELHRMTHLGDGFALTSLVRVDEVRWPSQDGLFTISALLVTPRAAWSGDTSATYTGRPLPTVVYMWGGPSMVKKRFKGAGAGDGILPLAARGYAVLVPNTRGRAGYGGSFRRGMRDGRSTCRVTYEDMSGGLDLIVRQGIADADRLGIFGLSFGGYATACVITQTTRFKAAVVREAHIAEWLTKGLIATPGTDWGLLYRDLYGMHDPFDPEERARLIAESPALNADRIRTPTLLLFGVKSFAASVGRPLFNSLQRFGIESEFILYDEGHEFVRPSAVEDGISRTLHWFDRHLTKSAHWNHR